MCSRCAKDHKTKDCKVTDLKDFSCTNCKAKGMRHDYTSVARICPVFIEAKACLHDRTPEMAYKYYLT